MAGRFFKSWLTRVGTRVSARTIHRVNAALNYLEVGRWMADRGFDISRRAANRRTIYDTIAAEIGSERVLYLEFGVHEGASMRIWSELLGHPESRLHGFDSFEGLPEDWNISGRKGTFSTQGAVPSIPDKRVTFYRGWFETTLPAYEAPAHDRLVINIDADLYSSAVTVLRGLERHMVPGTFVLFDEFADRLHELRAFDEFLRDHPGWRFRVVAADAILARVAFQRVS